MKTNTNNNKNINQKINLSTKVKIYENKKTLPKTKQYKKQKTKKRIFSVIIISLLLFSTIGALLNLGYIPVTALQPIRKPVGNTQSINIEKYMDDLPEIEQKQNNSETEKQDVNNTEKNLEQDTQEVPELNYIKALDKIKYEIFTTDATINTVISNYKNELKKDGYKLEYNKIKTTKGIKVHCLGFTKNLLAVGIMITDDARDILKQETVVIYSTGSVFEYQELMQRYKIH